MKIVASIFASLFLILSNSLAQDHHFSNYTFAPLQLNPSLCGSFEGNTRVGLIYREQWSQFIQSPFQTAHCFIDISFDGFRKNDWLSFGAQLIGDQAGDIQYQFNEVSPTFSYHFTLDNKYHKIITLGVELAMAQHKVGRTNFRFGDELSGQVGSSIDRELITHFNEGNQSINIGVNYQFKTQHKSHTLVGISVGNILKPKFGKGNLIDRRLNVHYSQQRQLSKTRMFKYSIYTALQGQGSNIIMQIHYGLKLEKESPFTLIPGIGYRVNDAIQLLLAINYNSWSFYAGYDVTVSSARYYNNGRGALEVGVNRTFLRYKKPKVTPILLCPRI